MSIYMSADEARLILSSLRTTREKFTVSRYPSDDIRKERLAEIDRAMESMRVIRDEAKLAEGRARKGRA